MVKTVGEPSVSPEVTVLAGTVTPAMPSLDVKAHAARAFGLN